MRTYLTDLLNYELWANQRIITTLDSVRNPPARAVAIMGHILSAQHIWYGRIANESVFVSIWEDIPISWMIETAERQHDHLVSYIEGLSEQGLDQTVRYANSKGEHFENSLFEILTHMSQHSAYHRGQVVQLIRSLVTEPPVTDYIVWKRGK